MSFALLAQELDFEFDSEYMLEAEIDAAYAELAKQNEYATAPSEDEATYIMAALTNEEVAFDLLVVTLLGLGRRRPNPKARSMRRQGQRYAIRKDHGTTAHRKRIEAINVQRTNRTPDGVRAKRRQSKMSQRSGNPRYPRTAR